jgi:cell division protein FtsB
MGNCVTYVVNKHIEKQRSQNRSLRDTREFLKARKAHLKHGLEIADPKGNCETSLHSHRKAQGH